MTRIVIVADIRLYRDGLALALNAEDDLIVAATTAGDADAVGQVRATQPDVILLDMAVRDSLDLIRRLGGCVVALAITETESSVIACAEAGAVGYIPRDASLAGVAAVVRAVAVGETVCSPRIAAGLLRRLAARSDQVGRAGTPALTPRESQILVLIEEGLSNKEIAGRLCIEIATVKNHVHNILEKLNVSRRTEAAAHLRRTTSQLQALELGG